MMEKSAGVFSKLLKLPETMTNLSCYFVYVILSMSVCQLSQVVQGAIPSNPTTLYITISVSQETNEGALFTWKTTALSPEALESCSLHYGDLDKRNTSMKTFPSIEPLVVVNNLSANIDYYALITCQKGKVILPSNTVQFSTKDKNNKNISTHFRGGNVLSWEEQKKAQEIGDKRSISSSKHLQNNRHKSLPRREHNSKKSHNNHKVFYSTATAPAFHEKKSEEELFHGHSSQATTRDIHWKGKKKKLQEDHESGIYFKREESKSYLMKDVSPSEPERTEQETFVVEEDEVFLPKIQPSRHFRANAYRHPFPPEHNKEEEQEGILIFMKDRHMDGQMVDPHNSKPSTSIILGVVCGVVGFIIINVTVVMAVRQFSLRRDQRRRMFELQLEQHGGYIYNLEDILNA